MLRGTRTLGLVVVMLSAVTLAGCAAPKPVTVSVRPSPTPTAVFTSNAEAFAAAGAVYEKYVAVTNRVLQSGGKGDDAYAGLMTAAQLKRSQATDEYIRDRNLHAVGSITIAGFKAQRADLRSGRVTAYVCPDLSKSRVFNSKNEDVTPSERAPLTTSIAQFEMHDGRLVLAGIAVWKGESIC